MTPCGLMHASQRSKPASGGANGAWSRADKRAELARPAVIGWSPETRRRPQWPAVVTAGPRRPSERFAVYPDP